ncbi:MAG: beta strand repeat-containing protein [Ardenticatenaceae bacterium]
MLVRFHKFIPLLVTLLVAIAFTATAYTFNLPEPQATDLDRKLTGNQKDAQIESSPILSDRKLPNIQALPDMVRRIPHRVRLQDMSSQLYVQEYKQPEPTIRKPIELGSRQRQTSLEFQKKSSSDSNIKLRNQADSSGPHFVATTCTVTTPADSGAGSLRQCLLDAVLSDTINFDPQIFPLTTPTTITLLSPLPSITTDGLTIDGSNAGVALDGNGLTSGSGFSINGADRVTIQGLQIVTFPWDGITLLGGASNALIGGNTPSSGNVLLGNSGAGIWLEGTGTTNNTVIGNYIGVDASGMVSQGNRVGVLITLGAQDNLIGGETAGARNLISGNDIGIWFKNEGTSGNQVKGNYVGTDVMGTTPLPNRVGVLIALGAQANIVGGTTKGAGNLISGNTETGIGLRGNETSSNQVQGNYIGTNVMGTASLGNGHGILIGLGAHNNTVGGEIEEARNLISGNTIVGILIQNEGTSNNRVLGNYIGTNATGTTSLGNPIGVAIGFTAQGNFIGSAGSGRNLISGNAYAGILIQNEGTSNNQVLGNYIGTDSNGTMPLSNDNGVFVTNGAKNNLIGGETQGAGNLISGNRLAGVWLQQGGTNNNQVQGNYIGTDVSGTVSLGNKNGLIIGSGAISNTIGGETEAARNIISGNIEIGVVLQNTGTSGNQVLGNYIGTDAIGMTSLGNETGVLINKAISNTIGGETEGARNLISGNILAGVALQDEETRGNRVQGNYIGTNVTGTTSLSNLYGVLIRFSAQDNIVGSGNLISGNHIGVLIEDEETTGNQVQGNYIGTDVMGTAPLSNSFGIGIMGGAQENVIGGAKLLRNVISGNDVGIQIQDVGTSDNQVQGNHIGLNVTSTVSLANNLAGIVISAGAQANVIGGKTEDTRNVISGNTGRGIQIQKTGTKDNWVLGNYIGTDPTGTIPLSNRWGVSIITGAQDNMIGDGTVEGRNLLSGNTVGVLIQHQRTSGNEVLGNYIGPNATNTQYIGNELAGVGITNASQNFVGRLNAGNLISGNHGNGVWLEGIDTTNNEVMNNDIMANALDGVYLIDGANLNTIGISNTIAYNELAGVAIDGETTIRNTITRNIIKDNGTLPIEFINPVPLSPPLLISYSSLDSVLSGNTCGQCVLELYANPDTNPAGTIFLGQIIANTKGIFTATIAVLPEWSYLSATVTDLNGMTSQFSEGFCTTCSAPDATNTPTNIPPVTNTPTQTATATPTPTVTSTPTPTSVLNYTLNLPIMQR